MKASRHSRVIIRHGKRSESFLIISRRHSKTEQSTITSILEVHPLVATASSVTFGVIKSRINIGSIAQHRQRPLYVT